MKMIGSVRLGSPTGQMFRSTIGTQSGAFKKLRYLPNRVPDETKLLVDSVFDLDTNKVLHAVGIFKLFLVVPMLILGIVLVSINSTEIINNEIEEKLAKELNATKEREWEPEELRPTRIGNESLAPVWTGIMLAASAATDFIAVWRRRGSTIILYMLTSTVTFVASILCIEYDRLQMTFILQNTKQEKYFLKYRLYLTCVVLASIAVAVGLLSIYVGSRMGALEESRLYMEREGKHAVLKKKEKIEWVESLQWLSKFVGKTKLRKKAIEGDLHGELVSEEMSSASSDDRLWNEDRMSTNLVLAPQNLCQPEVQLEQERAYKKSNSVSSSKMVKNDDGT